MEQSHAAARRRQTRATARGREQIRLLRCSFGSSQVAADSKSKSRRGGCCSPNQLREWPEAVESGHYYDLHFLMEAALEEQFGNRWQPEAMSEAASLCRQYALSAEDLYFKWEAFSLGFPDQQLDLSVDNLRELRKEIQASARPAQVKSEPGSSTSFATPGQHRGALRKQLGRGNLDAVLDGLATPTTVKKRNLPPSAAGAPASTPRVTTQMPLTPAADTDMLFTPAKPSTSATHRSSPITAALSSAPPDVKPLSVSRKALDAAPAKSSNFEARADALKVIESLNSHLEQAQPHAGVRPRVQLASNVNPASFKYRYMFEKLMDRSDALDRRIDEAAELMRQHYSIEELGDPSLDSQEDCTCVGRICTDVQAAKLHDPADKSKTSIWLESSRLLGGGHRVELRFDAACTARGVAAGDGGVGLFPGALVGVKGRNVGGQYFNVTELLMMPPIYPPESEPQKLIDYQYGSSNLDGRPMSVMLASGPFTTEDNLEYAPLQALMDEARRSKPDAVILLGPFVDANHPSIRSGDLLVTPKQLFKEQISSRLASLFQSSPHTTAILVPSLNDILSHQIVYPQSPLDKDPALALPKGAKFLPNPVIFSVNEVVFAVTSTDALFPLRTLEYLKDAPFADAEEAAAAEGVAKDNISRACRHLLRQRSFYPIFPAPLAGTGLEGVNLDVTHLDLLKFDEVSADVIVTPSKLGGQFVKIVDSALVVNPSTLTRGPNGGTFARFTIHPSKRSELESEVAKASSSSTEYAAVVDHRVWERARVELVKI